jgi:hypothetical protein
MTSHNPEDWELSLSQLPDDSIQLSQPLTSRRRLRDETEFRLRSLTTCQENDRQENDRKEALVIIFEK